MRRTPNETIDEPTEVLVASVRSTQHVVDAALIGADVVRLVLYLRVGQAMSCL